MKKFVICLAMSAMIAANANAQDRQWTLNTRLWTTNYWSSLIYNAAEGLVKHFAFENKENDSLWADRIIPDAELVFPIGLQKKGFDDPNNIYGPYHYAFGNPIKHLGDYYVGFDVSYKPSIIGFYAGAGYKSQEIVYKETDDNLRGFYFQPRAGLVLGSGKNAVEAGVFYDMVTSCGGSVKNTDKDMLKSGLGLDLGFSSTGKNSKTVLQFSMPLHNFINEDYNNGALKGIKRKVGYILLTQRVML